MKTQKCPGVKTPRGEVAKANLTLSVKAYQRLFVTSVMSGRTASSIVEELIETGLKSWSMPANLAARASSRQLTTSAICEASVNLEAEIAA